MAFVVDFIHQPNVSRSDTPDTVTEKHKFLAEMSEPTRFPRNDILASARCPKMLSQSPTDPSLFVVDIQTEQHGDSPQVFMVTVTYSNRYEANGTANPNGSAFTWIENPMQRPAVIEWGTYTTREIYDMAFNGSEKLEVPVITAAGEPILLEDDVDRRVIMLSKNVQSVDSRLAKGANFINKDTVRIGGHTFEPETLWLTKANISSLIVENRIPHFRLSFCLYHREEKWHRVVRHAGHYFRLLREDGEPGRIAPVMIQGQFPTKPIPLESNGSMSRKMAEYIGLDRINEAGERINRGPNTSALTPNELAEIWKNAKLTFRTKKRVIFNGLVPLQ
jgi:hypothetical protein